VDRFNHIPLAKAEAVGFPPCATKRHRPKKSRSGCLWCKPHKMNHSCQAERMKISARRGYESGREQLRCEGVEAA
jgi:hypothetical protein